MILKETGSDVVVITSIRRYLETCPGFDVVVIASIRRFLKRHSWVYTPILKETCSGFDVVVIASIRRYLETCSGFTR